MNEYYMKTKINKFEHKNKQARENFFKEILIERENNLKQAETNTWKNRV